MVGKNAAHTNSVRKLDVFGRRGLNAKASFDNIEVLERISGLESRVE